MIRNVDAFPPEEIPVARDPFLNCTLTGREAEAMIKKYGGDLFAPVEPAPMAASHTASFSVTRYRLIRVWNYQSICS